MSRSFKKNPVSGITTSESEKRDKQLAHRAIRAHFRSHVGAALAADEEEVLFDERNRAHSNRWSFAKDGKQWLKNLRVQHIGRAVHVLAAPWYARDIREVHQIIAK